MVVKAAVDRGWGWAAVGEAVLVDEVVWVVVEVARESD